ncbi:hypothetical protein QBC32DRAFT_386297 [Pseudoneurospora amorphoporcata]|uniref:Uncharacterized protein n=1 Tax=Pseudoneurospora amorphoporcata TaxID=241081 RepID=A0AAN6NXI7_9PEZI|nr:hypothetical protein QBC32DRAFT_386297 [Pseudoneurospora amorphoporcata]
MPPTCHACAQRFGETIAPAVDPPPPQEAPMVKKKKKKKNKKTKLQDGTNAVQVKIPWVLTTLGNLLDYVQGWIPGYHFAKRVVNNMYRSTSPTASLTIFSVYTVTSSDPIVSIAKNKRKRPRHKKEKPTSTTPASPPPEPASPSRRTCRRCHQLFKSRKDLFRHINICRSRCPRNDRSG